MIEEKKEYEGYCGRDACGCPGAECKDWNNGKCDHLIRPEKPGED